MNQQVPHTRDELQKHLQEQLGFLERSADSFDAGFQDEAKRLALGCGSLRRCYRSCASSTSSRSIDCSGMQDTGTRSLEVLAKCSSGLSAQRSTEPRPWRSRKG